MTGAIKMRSNYPLTHMPFYLYRIQAIEPMESLRERIRIARQSGISPSVRRISSLASPYLNVVRIDCTDGTFDCLGIRLLRIMDLADAKLLAENWQLDDSNFSGTKTSGSCQWNYAEALGR